MLSCDAPFPFAFNLTPNPKPNPQTPNPTPTLNPYDFFLLKKKAIPQILVKHL